MMRNTAVSFLVCVRKENEKLDKLKYDLDDLFTVSVIDNLDLITVRHANEGLLEQIRKGKEILFEEEFGETYQMVMSSGSFEAKGNF